jgi:hypothetical protein
MFVVIISFPPIRAGKEPDFLRWFESSNQAFSGFKGFMRRRLLEPVKGGTYAAIVGDSGRTLERKSGFRFRLSVGSTEQG